MMRLEEKQQVLERDVIRYRERRAIEHQVCIICCENISGSLYEPPLQIAIYGLWLPYVQYRESKAVYDKTRLKRDRAAADFRQMEEENKPMKLLQA